MYSWEKQSRENKPEYEAFCRFREAGNEPELAEFAVELRTEVAVIAEMAKKRNWQPRRREFRSYIARLASGCCGEKSTGVAETPRLSNTDSQALLRQIVSIVNARIEAIQSEFGAWSIDDLIKFTSLYSKTMLEASKFLATDTAIVPPEADKPTIASDEETIRMANELLTIIDQNKQSEE